jgi:tetratricopeptide (TPR) repeat protein
MRYFLSFFLVLSLFSWTEFTAQDVCDCKNSKVSEEKLNDWVEAKNQNDLFAELERVEEKSIACSQFSLVWKIQFYLKLNEQDSVKKKLLSLEKSNVINNCPHYHVAFNYYNGYLFLKQEQYDSATFYLLKAVDLANKNNLVVYKAKSNLTLATVFDRLAQPEKSILYYKAGLEYAKKIDDKKLLLGGMANLQSCYGLFFDKTQNSKYLDSVKLRCFETLTFAKSGKARKEIIRSYVTLAGAYLSSNDFELGLRYCDSAIDISNPEENKSQLHSAYYKAAQCYIELKQYKNAIMAADSSLKYADSKSKKSNAIYRLYEANKAMGNFDKALVYLEQSKQLDEEVMMNDRMDIVTELEQKYNKSENEKKISELNKEKEISGLRIKVLVFGFILAVLIILFIVFSFRQKMLKNKQAIMETEQRLNRARINPHFFFNALTTMQGLALKENDGKKIALNLFSFSKLMRQTLESTFDELIVIEKEIDFLKEYLKLQQLRSPNKFEYDFYIDEEIDATRVNLPAMILQPFVENAIEHGFRNIEHMGKLQINFIAAGEFIKIIVQDNGWGISKDKLEKNHISRATQITKDRLFLLNKLHKGKAKFDIKENIPNGVVIEIVLPLILK